MSIVISEDIVKASGLSEQEFILEFVLLLFQQEKTSLGKGAELLNISQFRFQKILSDRGMTIHYDVEEFKENIPHFKANGWL
ncbi:MAG: UPF0175 family protein [Planktothrix sp.]